LTWPERAAALTQLWSMARAVHCVDLAQAAPLARQRAWYNSNDPAAAAAATQRLEQQGLLTFSQARAIRDALHGFWATLPGAALALNHGDLTLDNALWQPGQVTALLDFEYAVVAPVQLDLNVLLTCGFGPDQDDPPGARELRAVLSAHVAPELAQPGAPERLLGYAILLEQWKLEDWLAHPDGVGALESWDPYRRLRSLANGQGGYLAPLLGRNR
jgi:scyllo-inosamine 4-kinase